MHGGAIPPHATGVNDILFGNGKRYCKTQGNEMYHHLVQDFVDEYAKQVHSRKSKTTITKSIIEAICMVQPPGRFLLMTILLPTTGAETNQQGAETLLLLIY